MKLLRKRSTRAQNAPRRLESGLWFGRAKRDVMEAGGGSLSDNSANPPESARAALQKLLGYVLAASLLWEAIGRPILSAILPHATLPPPLYEELAGLVEAFF